MINKALVKLFLFANIIFLIACGGGGSSDQKNEVPKIEDTSAVSSSLVIEDLEKNQFNVLSAEAFYNSETLPFNTFYSVGPSNLKGVIFSLKTDKNETVDISIAYELKNSQPFFVTFKFKDTQLQCFVNITRENENCGTFSIRQDDNLQVVEIEFKNTHVYDNTYGLTENTKFLLNGTLKGKFSKIPLSVNDLAIFSKGILNLNGKPISFIFDPETYKFYLPNLNKSAHSVSNIRIHKDRKSEIFIMGYPNFFPGDHGIENEGKIVTVDNEDFAQISFNQTNFIDSSGKLLTVDCENTQPLVLSGEISVPHVKDQFSITAFKNSDDSMLNFNSRAIDIEFSENYKMIYKSGLSVKLDANSRVKKIKFATDMALAAEIAHRYSIADWDYSYSCAQFCEGITVDKDGYGVEFHNTKLKLDVPHDELKNEIILNGKFRYYGL